MTAADFARLYWERGCPKDDSLMTRVFHTDVSNSIIVFRQGHFQVELYFMNPNAKVVDHAHPFESVTIFCGGSMRGGRNGVLSSKWCTSSQVGRVAQSLNPGDTHSFEVGPEGAVFYIVSKWDDPQRMTSATIEYIGAPLGPVHSVTLESVEA